MFVRVKNQRGVFSDSFELENAPFINCALAMEITIVEAVKGVEGYMPSEIKTILRDKPRTEIKRISFDYPELTKHLYFTKDSTSEFQRIKRVLESLEKK